MKKSNIYFTIFFVLMFGAFTGFFIEPLPGAIAIGIFLGCYAILVPVTALMIRSENREDLAKHTLECKCTCDGCCKGIKLKKKWGNRK